MSKSTETKDASVSAPEKVIVKLNGKLGAHHFKVAEHKTGKNGIEVYALSEKRHDELEGAIKELRGEKAIEIDLDAALEAALAPKKEKEEKKGSKPVESSKKTPATASA